VRPLVNGRLGLAGLAGLAGRGHAPARPGGRGTAVRKPGAAVF